MRCLFTTGTILVLATCLTAAAVAGEALQAGEPRPVTLMGMLQEFMYPESKFHGAQSSDAAVAEVRAIKSRAILSTPDSVEQVLAFYCKKLHVDRAGQNLDANAEDRVTTERSVLIQEVASEGSTPLYVIAINGAKSSTTLVISRSADDTTTRIAWSNYRQLWP